MKLIRRYIQLTGRSGSIASMRVDRPRHAAMKASGRAPSAIPWYGFRNRSAVARHPLYLWSAGAIQSRVLHARSSHFSAEAAAVPIEQGHPFRPRRGNAPTGIRLNEPRLTMKILTRRTIRPNRWNASRMTLDSRRPAYTVKLSEVTPDVFDKSADVI